MKQVIVLVLLLFLLGACGGKEPINWESRVGVYTSGQAEEEWGKPTGKQELANGNTLYMWYDQGRRGWHNVLALVFAPDGTLVEMERNERE